MNANTKPKACVIIAGGKSRRFGEADKLTARLGGARLIDHVVDRLSDEANLMAVSVAVPADLSARNLPVLIDTIEGYAGPMAGVLSAMYWAASHGLEAVFTAPGDTPFLPSGILGALDRPKSRIVVAQSLGRNHYICARWALDLADDLEAYLREAGDRSMRGFISGHMFEAVDFPVENGLDPFFNINTPEHLHDAELFAGQLK